MVGMVESWRSGYEISDFKQLFCQSARKGTFFYAVSFGAQRYKRRNAFVRILK